MEKKERQSNLELLKIIAIFMVIFSHFVNDKIGGAYTGINRGTQNYILMKFLYCISIVAVNIFILITGYFMIDKEEIKKSKIIQLIELVVFYGIVIYVFSLIFDICKINKESIILFISTIFDRWFVVIYIILYLLIPYINKCVKEINKKEYIKLLLILYIFFSIWPSIVNNVTVRDNGYGILNFITLYLTGGYIKKHNISKKVSFYIIGYLCTLICNFAISFVSTKYINYNFIITMMNSVFLFIIFLFFKIKNNSFINYLATNALAVYIIHENKFISKILYRDIFKIENYYNTDKMLLNLTITVIGIFIICTCIEIIRRKCSKKLKSLILYFKAKNEKIINKE